MITRQDTDNFYRDGKGKVLQFYITDNELEDVFNELLVNGNFTPFKLIVSNEDDNYKYTYHEHNISDFGQLRKMGHFIFFLRSLQLTPEIELPSELDNVDAYYMYNGLIRFWHGSLKGEYVEESNMMLIDSYFNKENPSKIYKNEEYLKLFNRLKKAIRSRLKLKSELKATDGRIFRSNTNNVSEGFSRDLARGLINSKIGIVGN